MDDKEKSLLNKVVFWGIIILLLGAAITAAVFQSKSIKAENDLLDAREQLAEKDKYWDSVSVDGAYFVNRVLKVSGSDRILDLLEKNDPDFYNRVKKYAPVEYQQITVIQKRIDTVYASNYIMSGDTLIIPIKIDQGMLHVNGRVLSFPKDTTKQPIVELSVYKDTTKIVIIIVQDEKTKEYTAQIKSNDPDIVISSIDTRITQDVLTEKRNWNLLLGGGVVTNFTSKYLSLAVYGGYQNSVYNYGLIFGLDMFGNNRIIDAARLTIHKIFWKKL